MLRRPDLGATRDMTALVLVFADDDGGLRRGAVLLVAGRDLAGARGRRPDAVRGMGEAGTLAHVRGPHDGPESGRHEDCRAPRPLRHPGARVRPLAHRGHPARTIGHRLRRRLVPSGRASRTCRRPSTSLERLVEERQASASAAIRFSPWQQRTRRSRPTRQEPEALEEEVDGRIDPLVALTMALGVATRHEAQPAWTPMLRGGVNCASKKDLCERHLI